MIQNILISAIFCAVCTFFYHHVKQARDPDKAIPRWAFAALVVLALAIRVRFALQDYCFTYDVGTFKAWGSYAHSYGLKNLYSQDIFLDYPPGYIYLLYLLNRICAVLGITMDSVLSTFIFKLPAIIADFACSGLIYTACKNSKAKPFARFAALAFLFMPAVIYNSSVWGQVESFYLFFVALSIWLVIKGKTAFGAAAFAYGLICKPQSLMFGAVLLFFMIKRKSLKELLKAVGTGVLSFYIMMLPCCTTPFSIGWIFDLYKNTMQGYRHFTVNAYNVYYLLGLNWQSIDNARFGNVNVWIIALVVAVTAFVVLKGKGTDRYFAAAAMSAAVIFSFCTMMHERYIYPAILFAFLAFAQSGERKHLTFAAVTGSLNFFNAACVMAMYYGTFTVHPKGEKLASALVGIVAVVFVVWLVHRTLNQMNFDMKKYLKSDYIVVFITVVYACFAFMGLGSTKAPQSFYQSTADDTAFTIELETPADIGSVWVYSGLGDEATPPYGRKACGSFEITATDANGAQIPLCTVENLSVYTWKQYTEADVTEAVSVTVTAKSEGAVLGEIVLCGNSGNVLGGRVVPNTTDSTNPYNAVNAFDEQETAPFDASYYYSMYFDEIYHGRTAWEQLNGMQIYETTHPPLGKIIISLGIKLFGMTPFGWRFMGALCGVVMLPVIYLLASAVAGKKTGVLAALLLSLDFMHLTQTRIATVDTFVVLFCLLTFLFMVYYHKTPFRNAKREWAYLFLSGGFMGCAVASKWNGAYPMVALAVFFFISLYTKYKHSGKTKSDRLYVAKTLYICCIAFVAVPLVIYALSYLPVIDAYTVKDYFRQLWGYQTHMYNYHSTLEAEHFFSSMWYTWPFSIKPVWYSISTLKNGWYSSISAFGNPLIWLMTPFASLYCLYRGIKGKKQLYLMVAMGWLASYLPWVAVSRLCFIYHYFPCAVFGIVAIALCIKDIMQSKPKLAKGAVVYLALCGILFVMFLPVTTGLGAPRGYLEFLEILPRWYFIN